MPDGEANQSVEVACQFLSALHAIRTADAIRNRAGVCISLNFSPDIHREVEIILLELRHFAVVDAACRPTAKETHETIYRPTRFRQFLSHSIVKQILF